MGLAHECLMAGSVPMGPSWAQPKEATWDHPHVYPLPTGGTVGGAVQCSLGSSQRQGPRQLNLWTKNLAHSPPARVRA